MTSLDLRILAWSIDALLSLLTSALTYLLAPVVVLFAKEQIGFLDNSTKFGQGYYLPNWLKVFQAPDNSLDGDEGWRTLHWQWRFKLPKIIATYVGRVGWLWRNPGYGFGLITLTNSNLTNVAVIGNPTVGIDPFVPGTLLIDDGTYFQYRKVAKIFGSNYILYYNAGWNIKGLYESPKGTTQVCTFAFSPRIRKLN